MLVIVRTPPDCVGDRNITEPGHFFVHTIKRASRAWLMKKKKKKKKRVQGSPDDTRKLQNILFNLKYIIEQVEKTTITYEVVCKSIKI